jgi:hypothetical protein
LGKFEKGLTEIETIMKSLYSSKNQIEQGCSLINKDIKKKNEEINRWNVIFEKITIEDDDS